MAKSPIDATAVANWFLHAIDRDAGDTITHLKLQKLLYFAQAWFLANNGKPLFSEDFQAWAHGPVLRSIFDQYKDASWQPIAAPAVESKLPADVQQYLAEVFEVYGKYSAKHLERLTHDHKPWKAARDGLPPEARCERIIPKQAMRDFYGKKIKKSWSGSV